MRLRFLAILAVPTAAFAQAAKPVSPQFTAEDILDITTVQVADLSADGRWAVATTAIRRDGFGNDFRRDGDPTYLRPGMVRLWVIDTRNGERRPVFTDKRNVRNARWSPDGAQLAYLQLNGDAFDVVLWNRTSASRRP